MNATPTDQSPIASLRIDPTQKAQLSKPTSHQKRWWIIGAMVFLGGLGLALNPFKTQTVTLATVSLTNPSQEFLTLTAAGYVVAQRRASLATKATGRLVWLGVREGSVVKQGELIARLDNRDVAAQFEAQQAQIKVAQFNQEQAYAELADAKASAERTRLLINKGFTSPATLDSAVARENKAKAALAGAQASLVAAQASAQAARLSRDETDIRAPFDAVVIAKSANVGDVITPFSNAAESKGAVVTVADLNTLEVETDVSESNIGKVRVGQPCEIVLDALPGDRFPGSVASIVPTVDRAKATVTVKVKFERIDPKILPDMSAKVNFLSQAMASEQKPLLTIPNRAVQQGHVFVIEQGKAKPIAIQTGRVIGQSVEVVSSESNVLRSGSSIISPVPDNLKAGQRIDVAKSK